MYRFTVHPGWFASAIRDQEQFHAPALSSLMRFINKSGSRLLFHIVSNIVPSAVQVLTVVFGMRTGVAPARIATRQTYCFKSGTRFQMLRIRNCFRPEALRALSAPMICTFIHGERAPRSFSFRSRGCRIISHDNLPETQPLLLILRKEVIQPHLPIQLPCYDFTPVIGPAFDGSLLKS